MASLRLCQGDPVVDTLRTALQATPIRTPEERYQPLTVLARHSGEVTFIGFLGNLLREGDLVLPDGLVQASRMADLSGRRTSSVKLDFGLQILEGFLRGFGVPLPAARIAASAGVTGKVSFSFHDVERRWVDLGSLGRLLSGARVDVDSPTGAMFLGPEASDLLVVSSVVTSRDFSIAAEQQHDLGARLQVPAVQALLSSAGGEVKVSTLTGRDLLFEGPRPLSFAFTCVRFYLDELGALSAICPDDVLLLSDSDTGQPEVVDLWDERALLEVVG